MKRLLLSLLLLVSVLSAEAIVLSPEGVETSTTYYDNTPYERTHFIYDTAGRILTEEKFNYTTEQGFYVVAKYEYTYNDQGKLTSKVYYSYNTSKETFQARRQTTYTYDTKGRLTQDLSQTKTPSTSWTNSSKNTYEYNDQDLVTKETEYTAYSGNLQLTGEKQYTYDEAGQVSQRYFRFVQTDGWHTIWSTYTYDKGLLASQDNYGDEEHTNHTGHNDYTYDTKGRLTKNVYYEKGASDAEPVKYSEATYDYNSHGDLTAEAVHYYVIEAGGIYRNEDYSYSYSYEYDAKERITRFNFTEGDNIGYTIYEYVADDPTAIECVVATPEGVKKVYRNGRIEITDGCHRYGVNGIAL